MHTTLAVLFAASLASCASAPVTIAEAPPPPADMPGFLRVADEAAAHRESRLVDEATFLRMSREPGTIVLDARSAERYAELHVAGAVNLSFPDIAIAALEAAIPDRTTRVLIYCNNNFAHAERPFPEKRLTAALNLSTFVALYDCGYRNVYELAPRVDPRTTMLPLEGSLAAEFRSAAAAP
jgi:phage shock protein E